MLSLPLCCVYVCQGEEGPPSLEYIKAKDLFPQKELVKEDDNLQVSPAVCCETHEKEGKESSTLKYNGDFCSKIPL